MSKVATKACNNIYYKARRKAAADIDFDKFKSRAAAAEVLNMHFLKLSNIELGKIIPHQDDVIKMVEVYNAPELYNYYCSCQCPIGCKTMKQIENAELFQSTIKLFGALSKSDQIIKDMTDILADGVISEDEEEQVSQVMKYLDNIIEQAQALKLANEKRK
ncbi:MAG: hypothetical protein ACI3VR_02325 [Intestinibacter sp.]|uniref:hypothetical protein n=1 Tax=Intestinibacter sp. TaxID=1965304 RepID=UPI003F144ECB